MNSKKEIPGERVMFEAWAKDFGFQQDELGRFPLASNEYYNCQTEVVWKAWHARAEIARGIPPLVESGKVVAGAVMSQAEAIALITSSVVCCEARDREPCPSSYLDQCCVTCPYRIAAGPAGITWQKRNTK